MSDRVIILGAAGRDFHLFNTLFRGRSHVQVVAFTATQIPNIDGRRYPAVLAGPGYRDGIPIVPESQLEDVIRKHGVNRVIFGYSDVTYEHVMSLSSRAQALGATFEIPGESEIMLRSDVPVIAVCAIRTGAGKSQTSRYVARRLQELGLRTVVVRHPMPYGDLGRQAVQRFEVLGDLERHQTTIEEREEYEPHLDEGRIVFAGVDYEAILRVAEKEADVVIWDGGNNDLPFFRPDLHITVLDPFRPRDASRYYPSESNVRMADILLVNKVDTAPKEGIEEAIQEARRLNLQAPIVRAASPPRPDDASLIRGRTALVIEDGPSLTHGGMPFGAGTVAAREAGASLLVDPRPYATGSIAETYRAYPHMGPLLPAMGYGEAQIAELEETVRTTPADVVVAATPIDLARVMSFDKPVVRVRYDLEDAGDPTLGELIGKRVEELLAARP